MLFTFSQDSIKSWCIEKVKEIRMKELIDFSLIERTLKTLNFHWNSNRKNQSIVKISKNVVRRKTKFEKDYWSLVAFWSHQSRLVKVLSYILLTRTNLKIPIRKVSHAYTDFVDSKIVEIAKKMRIGGVGSTNRAL